MAGEVSSATDQAVVDPLMVGHAWSTKLHGDSECVAGPDWLRNVRPQDPDSGHLIGPAPAVPSGPVQYPIGLGRPTERDSDGEILDR